jgi:hypothetical protein
MAAVKLRLRDENVFIVGDMLREGTYAEYVMSLAAWCGGKLLCLPTPLPFGLRIAQNSSGSGQVRRSGCR